MEMDQELFEAFIEEVTALKKELGSIQESLSSDLSDPKKFLDFAQIIDRIYGTALTMGLNDVGEYLGVIRNTCRKIR